MHKIGARAVKNLKPLIKTRCLSYVPIDDRFFGLSDEEIELRGMTSKFEVHTSSCLKSDSVVRHGPSMRSRLCRRSLEIYKVQKKQHFGNSLKQKFRKSWGRKLILMITFKIIDRL